MNIHIYLHGDTKLNRIIELLHEVLRKEDKIMATLDEVLKDVTDESTLLDGISTLISGLQQQIKDLLAGTSLPADIQTKIDAIFATAEANKAKITSALTAGTPAVGTP